MALPRIIIADPDVDYIIPLQHKMAEDFFNKVDLEIITDPEYFDKVFSSPQKADILIISESLYDSSIQRHNIAYVFIMTEQYEEGRTAELNRNYIFKYTSIKEIFNEIIGKSGNTLRPPDDEKQETQVVLVYSAAGGTGKTTVSMGICASMTKNYKRVLYINASNLQCFSHMLENDAPIVATDVYTKLASSVKTAYEIVKHTVRKELFNYLPPFKAALMSVGLDYSIYEKIVQSAKKSGNYDFIIVDADSSFDEHKAKLIDEANKVIILTTQTMASVAATNTLVSNINGITDDKYVFICNNFDNEEDNALITPDISPNFTVSDYIPHFDNFNEISPEQLSQESAIQRVAFLIM